MTGLVYALYLHKRVEELEWYKKELQETLDKMSADEVRYFMKETGLTESDLRP